MMRYRSQMHLHFVGIGGIGMSGIAEVFLNQGYRVSGSDKAESDITRRLTSLGATIHQGHVPGNIHGAHVVVISSAVKADNPEVLEARRLRIPVIPRAEMLGELMRGKIGIAIAGTHGKTTTTSMMASILTAAELDPTIVIGGKVDSLGGSNAKLGQGDFVVAEADESDASFLHLPANYAVITNIDNDHMDHYGSVERLDETFQDFVGKLPFYGLAAVCGEDSGVRRNLERWTKPVVTYGWSNKWEYWASNVRSVGLESRFEMYERVPGTAEGRKLGELCVRVPGKHNVLNALGAAVIAHRIDISFDKIADGLASFTGVKRRFEICWSCDTSKRVIVDDYGHHPTEIAATLEAARSYWGGRIVTVFQPHRYSRTMHCKDGFKSAFRQSDVVYITDIYAAGEEPIPGVTSEDLVQDIAATASPEQQIHYVSELGAVGDAVLKDFRSGDLILCLGAGTITKLPAELKRYLVPL